MPSTPATEDRLPEDFFCEPEGSTDYSESLRISLVTSRLKISHVVDVMPLSCLEELEGRRVISPWYSGFKVYGVVYGLRPALNEALVVWGERPESISKVHLDELKKLNPELMKTIALPTVQRSLTHGGSF